MKKKGRPKVNQLETMQKQLQEMIKQRDQLNNGILHLDGEIKGFIKAKNETK